MTDCNKFQEFMPDAIDGRLGEPEKKEFDSHLQSCSTCRTEYELDNLTKEFIRKRFQKVKAPREVVEEINTQIKELTDSKRTGFFNLFNPVTRAAAAILLIFVVALFAYIYSPFSPESDHTVSMDTKHEIRYGNLLSHSVNNYELILAGTMQPSVVGETIDNLKNFFGEELNFPVALKEIATCEWVGGDISHHDGLPLAHIMYKIPKGYIYMCQTDWTEVQSGTRLYLSADAIESLKNTGLYYKEKENGYSVVLWLYGEENQETICAVVSPMSPTQLLDLFSYISEYQ